MTAEIPVVCMKLNGKEDNVYDIFIVSDTPDSPRPEKEHLRLTNQETGVFLIPITEPGTYFYRIYEKAGNDRGIVYDANVYLVTVFAANDRQEHLICAVSAGVEGKQNKTDKLIFCHQPILPPSAPDTASLHTGDDRALMCPVLLILSSAGWTVILLLSGGKALKAGRRRHDQTE